MPPQLVSRRERDQLALVENPDPLRQRLRLGEVVRAEQNGRVVRRPDLADELLHLELRARVEPGRRLVEQEQHRRGEQRARERDLLLRPAREVLHRVGEAVLREPHALQDLRDPVARLRRRHPVVARRVAEVLDRRHLLEEARLDRDAVHQAPDRAVLGGHVVAEDRHAAAVVQQQGREQADERRLPGAVLAQDRERLALLHRERDAVERGDALPVASEPPTAFAADELLAEVDDLDRRHGAVATRIGCDRQCFCVQHGCSFTDVKRADKWRA